MRSDVDTLKEVEVISDAEMPASKCRRLEDDSVLTLVSSSSSEGMGQDEEDSAVPEAAANELYLDMMRDCHGFTEKQLPYSLDLSDADIEYMRDLEEQPYKCDVMKYAENACAA